ncbi:MAG TPA: DUF4159 domain-containing protein [Gemmatimonadaceae bacterium]|nr:DUF4159 domain-containing protein [Gemmatimonadaceae bacterium]
MSRHATFASLLAGACALSAHAQRDCGPAGARDPQSVYPTAKYDGRYTFARIYYNSGLGGGFRGRGEAPWHHDYPNAEQHFSKLVSSLSSVRVRLDGSVIVALTDPQLFKYPIAYMSEPGRWYPSDEEVTALRKYLQKGGFLIFDDFANNDIYNLQEQMSRVIPKMQLIELKPDHPVFDSFYRVKSLEYVHPYYCVKSSFFGIFENNDPAKRMLAVVNYNNDLGELWEFSDWGYYAVNTSNEAYKLGLNYLIYAMSR